MMNEPEQGSPDGESPFRQKGPAAQRGNRPAAKGMVNDYWRMQNANWVVSMCVNTLRFSIINLQYSLRCLPLACVGH